MNPGFFIVCAKTKPVDCPYKIESGNIVDYEFLMVPVSLVVACELTIQIVLPGPTKLDTFIPTNIVTGLSRKSHRGSHHGFVFGLGDDATGMRPT
jgi:hypothetical protein